MQDPATSNRVAIIITDQRYTSSRTRGAKAASQLQPMAAQNYVMPSQSHALQMTSVAIFSWYISEGEQRWAFGSWRVSVQFGCGMCRSGKKKNRWHHGGVVGQVSLGNKVRAFQCCTGSEFLSVGVASAGTVQCSSVGDTY